MSLDLSLVLLLNGSLSEHLSLAGLTHLRATGKLIESCLDDGDKWCSSLAHKLPNFVVNPSLLELPSRHQLLQIVPSLLKAIVAEGTTVLIQTADDLKRLAKVLKSNTGGAQLLIGRFRFDGDAAASALAGKASPAHHCKSNKQMFRVGQGLLGMQHSSEQVLQVNLHFQGSQFQVTTKSVSDKHRRVVTLRHRTLEDGTIPKLTVDITVASQALILHHRAVPLTLDGCPHSSSGGISSLLVQKPEASQAMSQGLTFVMFVWEGRSQKASVRFSAALNLDDIRDMP